MNTLVKELRHEKKTPVLETETCTLVAALPYIHLSIYLSMKLQIHHIIYIYIFQIIHIITNTSDYICIYFSLYTYIYMCVCIYIYIYSLSYIIFHHGLSQETVYSSLCYTAGPHCLSILNVIVCIY